MKNLLFFFVLFAIQKMAAQSLVFAKDLGFHATDLSTAVDPSGAIFLAGTALSETDVDPGPLEKKLEGPTGKKVGFVCRFSAAGQLDWAVSLADLSNDVTVPFLGGDALKMGQDGLIHAVFRSNSAMKYHPGGLAAQGNAGIGGSAIVSLDAATGALVSVFDLWNSQNGSPFLPLQFNDFSVLPNGKIAVVGAFRGLLQPGTGSQPTLLLNSSTKLDGFLMLFDPLNISNNSGMSLGAPNSDEVFHAVGFGAKGQFVIGGEYYGSFDADPSPTKERWLYLYNSQGSSDAFVLVLDSAMAFVSVRDSYSFSPKRHKMESTPSGRTVFTIDLGSEIINPNGNEGELAYLGAQGGVATGYADVLKTAADATGFYQMGGERILPNSGPAALRMLFSKTDLAGNEVWKIGIDGKSMNFEGTSIAGSLDGKTVAVAGVFDGSVDFDPSAQTKVLTAPAGKKRSFLLKFSDPCPDFRLQFVESTPVSCIEKGRVEAGATGGAAPYFFEWQTVPPTFSPVLETSTGGFFGLTMIDSTGCERQTEVFVGQPTSLDPTVFDARTHLFSLSEFRPGFEQIIVVSAQNPFCQSKNGEIRLALDPKMTLIGAEPTPDFSVADTLVWLFDSLRADISMRAKVRVKLSTTAILGDSVCVRAEVKPSDFKPQNNVFLLKERIIGSFDPNDIAARPAGVCAENAVLPSQTMTYRIRFQNTGTASAINVRVLDTLPKSLDLNSLRIVETSHKMGIERPDSSVLSFVFDDINLPDSFSNEAASHGFIVFNLTQKPNLPDGERLENRAAIYFDFNAPVITNTIFQTVRAVLPICPTVSTGDFLIEKAAFSVAPNPISGSEQLQVLLERDFLGKIKIEVLSLDGCILQAFEKEKTAEIQVFQIENLPAETSFFVRVSDGKRSATRLVLKI